MTTLLACADASTDLAAEFSTTPFRNLRGVTLGMSGRDLKRVRPSAAFAPYLGRQERLPGYMVSYQFQGAASDSNDVGDQDKLSGVFITQMFEGDAAATAEWRSASKELAAERRKPDLCEQFPTGGMQARWFSGKLAFAIGVFPREPSAPTVGPRVIYAVSPMEVMKQPAGATPVACPT